MSWNESQKIWVHWGHEVNLFSTLRSRGQSSRWGHEVNLFSILRSRGQLIHYIVIHRPINGVPLVSDNQQGQGMQMYGIVSKLKLGDQLKNIRTIKKIGGFITWIES